MKCNRGVVTVDFNKPDSSVIFIAFLLIIMFGDNVFVGRLTDTKIYILVSCLFTYAFLYLLYKWVDFMEKTHNKPAPVEEVEIVPDTVFEHDDEASKIKVKIHKEIRRIPLEESETDGEDDDGTPSRKTTRNNKKVKLRMKKQEVLVVNFKSWSKHPNKWEWYYWFGYLFGWFKYEPNSIEIEKGSGHHEYVISGM